MKRLEWRVWGRFEYLHLINEENKDLSHPIGTKFGEDKWGLLEGGGSISMFKSKEEMEEMAKRRLKLESFE